jgi:hypothetical protein
MESASKSNRSSRAPQGNLSADEFHQCPKGGHIAKNNFENPNPNYLSLSFRREVFQAE